MDVPLYSHFIHFLIFPFWSYRIAEKSRQDQLVRSGGKYWGSIAPVNNPPALVTAAEIPVQNVLYLWSLILLHSFLIVKYSLLISESKAIPGRIYSWQTHNAHEYFERECRKYQWATFLGANIISPTVAGFVPRRSLFSFTQNFPKPLMRTPFPLDKVLLRILGKDSTMAVDFLRQTYHRFWRSMTFTLSGYIPEILSGWKGHSLRAS